MVDLGEIKPETHIKQNAEMLKSCPLFENGGNYSGDEVDWYRGQMNEIDGLFSSMIEKRKTHIAEINEQAA